MTKHPNVELGLGALTFVAGLPADVEVFPVARLAGFAAHLQEELAERPGRYRGVALTRM
jgi:citrate synthase